MSCRIHDASLTHRLTRALLHAAKSLIAERDLLNESFACPSTGEIDDADDRAIVESLDAGIDRYLELLAEAGAWPELDPPIDESDPESLPDWSLALGTIRRLVRVGDHERGALP